MKSAVSDGEFESVPASKGSGKNKRDSKRSVTSSRKDDLPSLPSSKKRSSTHSRGYIIFGVIVIALLCVGLVAAVTPAAFGGSDTGSAATATDAVAAPSVTPGAEEAQLRAEIQKNPKNVTAVETLANMLAGSDQVGEAINWYNKAEALDPNNEEIRLAFGRLLLNNGYAVDAEQEFKKATQLKPKDPEAYFLLGQLYQGQKPPQLAKARSMYQKAVDVGGSAPFAKQAQNALNALPATSATPSTP